MASSSKAASRRPKAETKKPKSMAKTKGKAKVKAAAVADGEDVEMQEGDRDAVTAKESDPPEENNDSGEEELEDVEERKAASKRCVCKFPSAMPNAGLYLSAQVALDRRDEMDVEGWKVGDPYVRR